VKYFIALLSSVALTVSAQTILTTVTPTPWYLSSGGTFATEAECLSEANKQPVGAYTCRSSTQVVHVPNIPAPALGSATLDIKPTTEAAVNAAIGAFRSVCKPSHFSNDDPIVYPGQPGAAHLHVFFGNTGTNYASTADSLLNTGNGTCRGGIANRSAYWVPAMLDARGGLVVPQSAIVYYKRGYLLKAPIVINTPPSGLRIVAGDAHRTTPDGRRTYFDCVSPGSTVRTNYIPTCPAGAYMLATVVFPQCWDGVNLDSADHKSHMAYPVQKQTTPYTWSCPATHPVAIPEIAINVQYASSSATWKLSSDMVPGGYSSHADWINAWNPAVIKAWNTNCVQASKDCHAHLLGDGRALF
jgi:hypothetical protein